MFRAAALIVIVLCVTSAASTGTSKNSSDDDRIIGGRNAAPNEFPFQASIQSDGIHFCGGSIINSRSILTAAHCTRAAKDRAMPNLTVRVGSTRWASGGQVRNIINMIEHPNHNPDTKDFDAAMIQLDSPIKYDLATKKIELADSVPTDGKIGYVCGWGVTNEQGSLKPTLLKAIEVTSVTRKNCSQPPWDYGNKILPSMICAYGKGKDGCQGDSGGPYVCKANGRLWGIVSWGLGCANEKYPGVYCAVAGIKKWITRTAESFER